MASYTEIFTGEQAIILKDTGPKKHRKVYKLCQKVAPQPHGVESPQPPGHINDPPPLVFGNVPGFYILLCSDGWINDIALIKLERDLPFDQRNDISPVSLPEESTDKSWPPDGASCVMKGWGCTKLGTTPNVVYILTVVWNPYSPSIQLIFLLDFLKIVNCRKFG